MTVPQGETILADLHGLVPGLATRMLCPAYVGIVVPDAPDGKICLGGEEILSMICIHLNDHHDWSREKIADWLETIDVDLTVALAPDAQPSLPFLLAQDAL